MGAAVLKSEEYWKQLLGGRPDARCWPHCRPPQAHAGTPELEASTVSALMMSCMRLSLSAATCEARSSSLTPSACGWNAGGVS